MRRIPGKRDANEPEIVQAFKAHGWSVIPMKGKGIPDLVCFKGKTQPRVLLVEVKGAKGKLTPDQVSWHRDWAGPAPVIVRTIEDVGNL